MNEGKADYNFMFLFEDDQDGEAVQEEQHPPPAENVALQGEDTPAEPEVGMVKMKYTNIIRRICLSVSKS